MISIKMDKADEARFRISLMKLIALSGEPVEEILEQQGRLFAVDAAQFTKRFGNTAKAGREHKKDVKSTIGFIYIRPLAMAKVIGKKAGEKAGRRFSNYIRRRDITKAQGMINRFVPTLDGYRVEVGAFDGGSRHKAWLKKRKATRLVVMDWRSVGAYTKKAVANVGEAKSGWAKAAEMLGGSRGIQAYAKKGHKTRGEGTVTGKGGKSELTVRNHSKYVLANITFSRLWRLRGKKIEAFVERMIKRKGKNITRRT